ncbi:type I-E CRISPR-associated protein Cas6/Cse3/CasE [Deinococcus arenicola]|uniref:Type I-E CRISPR-associated protein Cas6/Cse3/CasE n=1 Tax=Deinococcus arenicola TaxID=2994950 RepID=A0ABU4DV68_9DEIO|nr:type I-E CRISPR-associated protein Cas6/Cse3/CasE [Deinococcus sp. ZS9-10]MDV6376273.1 type I-E CRISPR-associated protein Cas6/Cse3/CasE [Deinococcus sp. ZS9-10]
MTVLPAPLHLSRLFLNPRHRHAARDLGSPYALHQTLRWAFPGAGQEGGPLPDGERLLWRLDTLEDPDSGQATPAVLVQSMTQPDWGALNARDPDYLSAWDVRTLNLSPTLSEGRVLHFRLRANVTVRRADEQGRSARHGVYRPEEQLAWLDRQGERGGFDVLGADITRSERVRTRKGKQVITLHAVTFEGALQVLDPTAVMGAVRGGLGHAKSLGCGLLSLAP